MIAFYSLHALYHTLCDVFALPLCRQWAEWGVCVCAYILRTCFRSTCSTYCLLTTVLSLSKAFNCLLWGYHMATYMYIHCTCVIQVYIVYTCTCTTYMYMYMYMQLKQICASLSFLLPYFPSLSLPLSPCLSLSLPLPSSPSHPPYIQMSYRKPRTL